MIELIAEFLSTDLPLAKIEDVLSIDIKITNTEVLYPPLFPHGLCHLQAVAIPLFLRAKLFMKEPTHKSLLKPPLLYLHAIY